LNGAFDLSQLITQARSFGARSLSLDLMLNSANASHRVEGMVALLPWPICSIA
jgi:hypothetical protein